jgi:hypothetical protein
MHLHGLLQDSIILLYKNMVLKQYPGLQLWLDYKFTWLVIWNGII